MSTRRKPALPPLPPAPVRDRLCWICGGAAVSFTAEDVPELMKHIGASVGFLGSELAKDSLPEAQRLKAAAWARFGDKECLFAWKSCVSICARERRVQ